MNLALALLLAVAGLSGTDRSFMTLAMNGNTSEIRQGQIFADSGDRLVQSYAQRITTDHSQANTQLISLARKNGVSTSGQLPNYPGTMGADHDAAAQSAQRKATEMKGLPPAQFFEQQIRVHQQSIAQYEKEIAHGSNAALVAYARRTLPDLKAHLSLAQADLKKEQHHD